MMTSKPRVRARCKGCTVWFTMPIGADMSDEAKAHCPACRETKLLARKKRPCLRCDRLFRPESQYNRICNGCHSVVAKMGPTSRAELNQDAMRRMNQGIYS